MVYRYGQAIRKIERIQRDIRSLRNLTFLEGTLYTERAIEELEKAIRFYSSQLYKLSKKKR